MKLPTITAFLVVLYSAVPCSALNLRLRNQLNSLEQQVEDIQDNTEVMEQQITTSESKRESFTSDMESLQNTSDTLQDDLQVVTDGLNDTTTAVTVLNGQVTDLQDQSMATNQAMDMLNIAVQALERQATAMNEEVTLIQNDLVANTVQTRRNLMNGTVVVIQGFLNTGSDTDAVTTVQDEEEENTAPVPNDDDGDYSTPVAQALSTLTTAVLDLQSALSALQDRMDLAYNPQVTTYQQDFQVRGRSSTSQAVACASADETITGGGYSCSSDNAVAHESLADTENNQWKVTIYNAGVRFATAMTCQVQVVCLQTVSSSPPQQ